MQTINVSIFTFLYFPEVKFVCNDAGRPRTPGTTVLMAMSSSSRRMHMGAKKSAAVRECYAKMSPCCHTLPYSFLKGQKAGKVKVVPVLN
jgi:hypothetical protein